jgi:hypothetical protein
MRLRWTWHAEMARSRFGKKRMSSLRSELISKPTAQPAASAQYLATNDGLYRAAGVALASSISAAFWMGVLAIALPATGVTPSPLALALTGMSIASFLAASLLALRANN